jgi:hypothetical protein
MTREQSISENSRQKYFLWEKILRPAKISCGNLKILPLRQNYLRQMKNNRATGKISGGAEIFLRETKNTRGI